VETLVPQLPAPVGETESVMLALKINERYSEELKILQCLLRFLSMDPLWKEINGTSVDGLTRKIQQT